MLLLAGTQKVHQGLTVEDIFYMMDVHDEGVVPGHKLKNFIVENRLLSRQSAELVSR